MNLYRNLTLNSLQIIRPITATHIAHTKKASLNCHSNFSMTLSFNTPKSFFFVPRYLFWSRKNSNTDKNTKRQRSQKFLEQLREQQRKQQQPVYKQMSPLVKEILAFVEKLELEALSSNNQSNSTQTDQHINRQRVFQQIGKLQKFVLEEKYDELLHASDTDWWNLFRMSIEKKPNELQAVSIWLIFSNKQKKDTDISCEKLVIEKMKRLFVLIPFIDQFARFAKTNTNPSKFKTKNQLSQAWTFNLDAFRNPVNEVKLSKNQKLAHQIFHEQVEKLCQYSRNQQNPTVSLDKESYKGLQNNLLKVAIIILRSLTRDGQASSPTSIPSEVMQLLQQLEKSSKMNDQKIPSQKSLIRQKQAIQYLVDQITKGQLKPSQSFANIRRSIKKKILGLFVLFLAANIYIWAFSKEEIENQKGQIGDVTDESLLKAKADLQPLLDQISEAIAQDAKQEENTKNQQ